VELLKIVKNHCAFDDLGRYNSEITFCVKKRLQPR